MNELSSKTHARKKPCRGEVIEMFFVAMCLKGGRKLQGGTHPFRPVV